MLLPFSDTVPDTRLLPFPRGDTPDPKVTTGGVLSIVPETVRVAGSVPLSVAGASDGPPGAAETAVTKVPPLPPFDVTKPAAARLDSVKASLVVPFVTVSTAPDSVAAMEPPT